VFVLYDASLAAASYIFRGGGEDLGPERGEGEGGRVGKKGGESFYPWRSADSYLFDTQRTGSKVKDSLRKAEKKHFLRKASFFSV
jgi:hypothetical protein